MISFQRFRFPPSRPSPYFIPQSSITLRRGGARYPPNWVAVERKFLKQSDKSLAGFPIIFQNRGMFRLCECSPDQVTHSELVGHRDRGDISWFGQASPGILFLCIQANFAAVPYVHDKFSFSLAISSVVGSRRLFPFLKLSSTAIAGVAAAISNNTEMRATEIIAIIITTAGFVRLLLRSFFSFLDRS